MIGKDSFCPRTGAPLSNETEYDGQGRPERATAPDEFTADSVLGGELTNGSVTSSKAALFNQFRRNHQRHAAPNDGLYRKTALALRRLKRAAEGRANWDVHVWYALYRRLRETGFDVEWMHAHADLRCPHCHSPLKYGFHDNGDVYALCATNCTEDNADQLREIREIVASVYGRSFPESPAPDSVLQFDYRE
ncbi:MULTISPECIES: hypothetical protein [Saliphagus]|uniref:Uncharacterized protein n=1 Tax=Saliphagus infecundisoli TaxID=1849069 RepID=A0ABD5QKT1_9EURY|nr:MULTISPECIES: hypothetical protein [Saliphagus]